MLKVCVIDRPDRAGDEKVALLKDRCHLQRVQPSGLAEVLPDTEVVFVRAGYWNQIDELLSMAPSLRWVHVNMAGVEHLMTEKFTASDVILTNSQGVLDDAIADFAVASVLMWSKGLIRSAYDTMHGQANYRELCDNAELSALIIGAGGIGTACAKALRRVGIDNIAGVRRSSRPLDPVFSTAVQLDQLTNSVRDYQVVVAALPATAQTEGLLDTRFFEALSPQSVFVNVGRGITADNIALAHAMKSRPEAAAILDVTHPEPLPDNHPLWNCTNVVISPHMSGDTASRHNRFTELFIENLVRFETGQELINQIDFAAGYGTSR